MKGKFTWGIVFLVVCATGCGSRRPPPRGPGETDDGPRSETLEIPPIHVRALGNREPRIIEAYDAAGLFEAAAKNLRKGECSLAVEMYTRLAGEFPSSPYASPSLYNSGLCNEQRKRYEDAAKNYAALVKNYPESRDVTDALFRLGGVYEKLQMWDAGVTVFDDLLSNRSDLEGIERIEALVRKGSSLMELGKLDEARLPLDEAVRLFRTGNGVSPSTSTFFYGMARFKIGEILQYEMQLVPLPEDETLLEPELEKKCRLLLDAQNEYTRTIKIAHPHWAAAAAYRIGNLYRSLWDDMIAAPIPKDLTDEQKEIYQDVLRDRISVLLKKAIVQWERTLKMARRLSLDNEWIEKTTSELQEIRHIMALNTKEE